MHSLPAGWARPLMARKHHFFLKQVKISVYVDGGYIWLIIASRIHLKALMTVPNAAED